MTKVKAESVLSRRGVMVLSMAVIVAMLAALMTPTQAHASAFPGKNGKIAFVSTRSTGTGVNNPEHDQEIFAMNPDGTGLKQLTKNATNDFSPSYSADGKKIVYVNELLATGNLDVFVMNADGKGKKDVSNNPAKDVRPSFSPDGRKIIFDSNRGSNANFDVFIMNADGTAQTALTSDSEEDENATFSPKGDKIAFVSRRTDPQGFADGDIFTMNPDGTQQTRLTDNRFEDSDPSFSPDGSKIAFTSNRFGNGNFEDFDILVMGADGSNPTNFTGSTATDDEPAFSPDGKKIAFVSTRDGGDEDIFTMDALNATGQTDVTPNQNFDVAPDWQPLGTTFTVNTTSDAPDTDTGDGHCDINAFDSGDTCTLRAAIQQADVSATRDTIKFNIPGNGVYTIAPSSPLPTITNPTVIDGYTQPGASPNTLAKGTNAKLMIELDGNNTFSFALGISDTSNSVIRGLVINNFGTGIGVFGSFASPTQNNRIEGNFIGTDTTGTLARDNNLGVRLDQANGNVVGGTTPATRNLISGNGEGIEISAGASGNKVLGNLIGTTANGTDPLGNGFWGVAMFNTFTSNNKIGDGTAAGANTIAFSERDGIEIDNNASATGNTISRNSIFANGGLGIDLIGGTETDLTNLVTANDPGDIDTGANNLQNFPVLSSAKNTSTGTTVAGKLNSTPGKTFKIQFISNPSGGNEGKTFIGQKSVTTSSSGNVSFTFKPESKVSAGQTITATATDSVGNTSEFSAPRTVTAS